MDDKTILDADNIKINIEKQLRFDRKRYFKKILGLIIINTILYPILIKNEHSFAENLLSSLHANLIGFNLIGFFLGIIVSIFPYKNLSFKKKYLRSSLLVIMIHQITMTLCLISIGLMTLVGWY